MVLATAMVDHAGEWEDSSMDLRGLFGRKESLGEGIFGGYNLVCGG